MIKGTGTEDGYGLDDLWVVDVFEETEELLITVFDLGRFVKGRN